MTIRSPQDGIVTTWEAKKNLMGRPVEIGQELSRSPRPTATGCSRSRCPTTTWGRSSPPRASSRRRSRPGKKKPGTTLSAYFVTTTDPEHRYHGYVVPDRLEGRDSSSSKHVVKVTVGFSDEVRKDYLQRQPGAPARGRGPGAGRLRRGPPGLRPAPRRDPRLLRNRPVPLAVPASDRERGCAVRVSTGSRTVRPGSTRLDHDSPDRPSTPDSIRPGGSSMIFSKKAAALAAGFVAALSAADARPERRAAGPARPSRRDASSSTTGHARLDREVRRRRPARGGDRADGAPDRHAGQEGRADRLPPLARSPS